MFRLNEYLFREDVIKFLFMFSMFGNLGFFIGVGFFKVVMNYGLDQIVLLWDQFFEQVLEKFEVDYFDIWKEGVGYFDVVFSVCVQYSKEKGGSYKDVLFKLKWEIVMLISWYFDKENREKFLYYFENFFLSWVIIINYDFIIESLMIG